MNPDGHGDEVRAFVAGPANLQVALLALSGLAILWLLPAIFLGDRTPAWMLLPPLVVLVGTLRVRRFRGLVLELAPDHLRLLQRGQVETLSRSRIRTVRLRRWRLSGAYWRLAGDGRFVDVPVRYRDRAGRTIGSALQEWLGPGRVPRPPSTRTWPPLAVISADVVALVALSWGLMWVTARAEPIVGECRGMTRELAVVDPAAATVPAAAIGAVAGTTAVARDPDELYDDPERTRRLARLEAVGAWEQRTPDGAYLQAVAFPDGEAAAAWQRWIVGEACLHVQAAIEVPDPFVVHAGAAWRYPYGGDGRSSDQLSFVVGDTRYLVLVVGGLPGAVENLAAELLAAATD